MYALQDQAAALDALASLPPNSERRALVRAALDSKWEGIQSAGLKVLGAWGDAESCDLLRRFLIGAFERPRGSAIRGVATKALSPHVGSSDVGWVLGLYFGVGGVNRKHELLELVLALPPAAARKHLIAALSDTDPASRQAAVKAIGRMGYPDRADLVSRLKNDPNAFVRNSVRLVSGSK